VADESPDGSLAEVEHFAPTGGRVTGILGLVVSAGFVVVWLVDRDNVPAPVGVGALVVGVLMWASLLRPRVSVSSETLYLRNMLETIHIPLAAVDELVVRQVLAVRVGDKRFVSPAVGRKLRKVMRAPRPQPLLGPAVPDAMEDTVGPTEQREHVATNIDYVDHVESRLRELIAAARSRPAVGAVRREPAWPEIGALTLATLLFVVTLLV
jgi:hypothetical protein